MQRILVVTAVLLAALSLANGLYMIASPTAWYHAVPGVSKPGRRTPTSSSTSAART